MYAIRTANLTKKYKDIIAVDQLNLQVKKGELFSLLGVNGAGKTTLFNCLNEDIPTDGGSFCLENDDGERQPITAEDIGYVLSTPVVPEFLTAREFLKFFLEINLHRIPAPKEPDVYLDYMQIDPEDR